MSENSGRAENTGSVEGLTHPPGYGTVLIDVPVTEMERNGMNPPVSKKRGRGRPPGARNKQKLGAVAKKAQKANTARIENMNYTKGRMGRPPGTGKWQRLEAQLRQSNNVPAQSNIQGSSDKMETNCPTLRRCTSLEIIKISSSDEYSGYRSAGSEPLHGNYVVTSALNVKVETHDPSQDHNIVDSRGIYHSSGSAAASAGIHEMVELHQVHPLGAGVLSSSSAVTNADTSSLNWDSSPLMKAIIKKHGDITKSCKFQSQLFKTNCLDGVCKIVKKLQDTRLEDVNPDFLKELYSFIKDAKSVQLDVEWLEKHVDMITAAVNSESELQKLEEAERDLEVQNREKWKAIELKRIQLRTIEQELRGLEEEFELAKLKAEDIEAQIRYISCTYKSCSYKCLMAGLL